MLNNYCLHQEEDLEIMEKFALDEKVSDAIGKFINITGKDMNDIQLSELKNELKEEFFEYIELENIQACDVDSLDNIAKVAFHRLVKASREYFYQKNSNCSYETLENLRIKANNCKRDYELIMVSS